MDNTRVHDQSEVMASLRLADEKDVVYSHNEMAQMVLQSSDFSEDQPAMRKLTR